MVRSWAKRRIKSAIIAQLKAQGFEADGRECRSSATDARGPHTKRRLVGTAEISVLQHSLDVKYQEILRQSGLVVQEILKVCGFPKREFSTFRKLQT